jgi:hypothetical protein
LWSRSTVTTESINALVLPGRQGRRPGPGWRLAAAMRAAAVELARWPRAGSAWARRGRAAAAMRAAAAAGRRRRGRPRLAGRRRRGRPRWAGHRPPRPARRRARPRQQRRQRRRMTSHRAVTLTLSAPVGGELVASSSMRRRETMIGCGCGVVHDRRARRDGLREVAAHRDDGAGHVAVLLDLGNGHLLFRQAFVGLNHRLHSQRCRVTRVNAGIGCAKE